MQYTYDVIVLGAGPAGYEAALELGKYGKSVCLIDKAIARLGGTCLNEGCIPAKNYIESALLLHKIETFKSRGLSVNEISFELNTLRESTQSLIADLQKGISGQLKRLNVEMMCGEASFADTHTVQVKNGDEIQKVSAEHIIIATGSKVRNLDVMPIDGAHIIDSTGVFALQFLPKSIAIVGGGAIGCEFASFFQALGVDVTLIEYFNTLIPAEDEDVSKALQREFVKKDIQVKTGVAVESSHVVSSGVELKLNSGESLKVERVLVAAGRLPNTDTLNSEAAGIILEKGFVDVNEFFQTNHPHIYAIGDVINTLAFAHTAYKEAKVVARNIAFSESGINDKLSPAVTFSHPQIASIGIKEKEAKEQALDVTVQKLFFKASGKAKIHGDDSGFIKLITQKESGVILGASIIGVDATEIIHEILLAIETQQTVSSVGDLIHAHPTVAESIGMLAHMMQH